METHIKQSLLESTGQEHHRSLNPDEIRVQVRARASELPSGSSPESHCVTVAGRIEEIGLNVREFGVQDKVVACLFQESHDFAGDSPYQALIVRDKNVWPRSLKAIAADAAAIVHSLWTAAAILDQEMSLSLTEPQDHKRQPTVYDSKRILVLGGETALGVAMVHLLRKVLPECKILVTSTLHDQTVLLQRTIALVQLGATFAIDGTTPDLMDELKRPMQDYVGVDVIVDIVGGSAGRTELLELLVGTRTHIDCTAIALGGVMKALLGASGGDLVWVGESLNHIMEIVNSAESS